MRRTFSSRFVERHILLAVLKVVGRPWLALLVATLVLAGCVSLAMSRLNVSSDQDKLFSKKVKFFRDFVAFERKFPENDAVYVVIEPKPGKAPALAEWTAIADAIAANLRAVKEHVGKVEERIPIDQPGSQALLFDKADNVRENFHDLAQFGDLARLWGERGVRLPGLSNLPGFGKLPVLGRTPIQQFLGGLSISFSVAPDEQAVPFVRALADGWTRALTRPDEPIRIGTSVPDLARLNATTPEDLGYFYVPDDVDKSRHLLLVRAYPKIDYTSLTAATEAVDAMRKAVQAAAKDFPDFEVGVTGRPALDADEMRTSDEDSTRAEIIAMIAVFIGLVVMLRSIWLALAAEIALAVGIGWTFGWATVSVGELNLLSLVFLIALIGIGMDYLVQVLTRYRHEARRHARPKAVWARVFRHVSAPINTACMGAAGAFLVSIFTEFRGAAELGIIAGGGLLLCLMSAYTVLPAMLTIRPLRVPVDISRRPKGVVPPPLGARRLITPAVWIAMLCCVAPFARRVYFDPNLLNLQAPNLESTKLIRKLQSWSAVVLSKDPAMLRRVRDVVQRSPLVESTESILTAEDNARWLADHAAELPKIRWTDPQPLAPGDQPNVAGQARALAEKLVPTPTTLKPEQRKEREATADALRRFAASIESAPPALAAERLSAWQATFVAQLRQMIAQFSPGPLDLMKVPAGIRTHLVSADGTYALYIYPKADLWDRENLRKFVNDVDERVATVPDHPVVTGLTENIYRTTAAIRDSFVRATAYALVLIFVLVLIDLKDVGQTFAAVSVLALGLPMLIAVMGLSGENWNFANFFALPILIGAGHEYGVFLIHRYREALRDPRRVWRFWDVADRALLLCAYVTSTSFGFYWFIAHHRGLKSLGWVMAVGTACIYLSSITVVRPLLLWRLEKKQRNLSQDAPMGDDPA